jgi:hypothetical protein
MNNLEDLGEKMGANPHELEQRAAQCSVAQHGTK